MSVIINSGTQTAIASDTIGSVNYGIVKIDVGNLGSSVPWQGTVTVGVGTVNHGTIDAGTVRVDGRPKQNILSYGTTYVGTNSYATLVGSASVGVGTSTWVNDISIINSGTVSVRGQVGFGTALSGTSILAQGLFLPNGGIEKSYSKAVNAGMTNQDLVCYIGTAGGTLDVNVSYFVSS